MKRPTLVLALAFAVSGCQTVSRPPPFLPVYQTVGFPEIWTIEQAVKAALVELGFTSVTANEGQVTGELVLSKGRFGLGERTFTKGTIAVRIEPSEGRYLVLAKTGELRFGRNRQDIRAMSRDQQAEVRSLLEAKIQTRMP